MLQAQTETDLFSPRFYPTRQPDTDKLRTGELAGTAPPKSPLIEVTDKKVARNDGNAKGGIRTPLVDFPLATLSGEPGGATSAICSLFGFTKPFTGA